MVTIDNVEEYIDLVTDFCLYVGIRRQMEALKGLCSICLILLLSQSLSVIFKILLPVIVFGNHYMLQFHCVADCSFLLLTLIYSLLVSPFIYLLCN